MKRERTQVSGSGNPKSPSDPEPRALQPDDFDKGHLDLLKQLTTVGKVSKEDYAALAKAIAGDDWAHTFVIEESKAVQATGTLLIEPKFTHKCGVVGHIEDVVVNSASRGKKFGRRMLLHLIDLARSKGCYKCILDCHAKNAGFYEKLGFEQKDVQMARYFRETNQPRQQLSEGKEDDTSAPNPTPASTPSRNPNHNPIPNPNLRFRGLEKDDFDKGFLCLLGQLTEVGVVARDQFLARFQVIRGRGCQISLVVEEVKSEHIMATGTLLLEDKFTHSRGRVGHIEDIVVDSKARGLGLGRVVIQRLVEVAEGKGCYKCILNCNKTNASFYEKCGFKQKEVGMALYFNR